MSCGLSMYKSGTFLDIFHCIFGCYIVKMFLLALCLVGTALAAPAIPEAPFLPAESHVLISPYITYPDPTLRIRALDIEPEPKEEIPERKEEFEELKEEFEEPKQEFEEPKQEFEEPKQEFPEPEEPKEILELPAAPELPKPEAPKPFVIKLEVPIKPPGFITNWISSLPISIPNFSLPSFITNWFHPTPVANPARVLYGPGYYTGYPGAVIVEAPKL